MLKRKLEVRDVTVSFEGKAVIEDISVDLYEKEIVSILGTSGVGKTTLFNVIAGLIVPDGGKVSLNAEDITGTSTESLS